MFINRPFVLSLAGFDPSGGAGLLADCKTFERLKVYGLAIPTANTLQTEQAFHWVDWQELSVVVESLKTLLQQYDVKVIKIGIVPNLLFLQRCVETIRLLNKETFIVWDPVLVSTSGYTFIDTTTLALLQDIFQHINLITPNFKEIHRLVPGDETALEKAVALSKHCNVLLKGGHNEEALGIDYLVQATKVTYLLPEKEIHTEKHGSGCVLASAICSYMAQGLSLEEACIKAKRYIELFLNSNTTLLGYHD